MGNILDTIISSQLAMFANSYVNTSQEVFYDENTRKLIHPGEFGGLRESLVRDLLKNFLPEAYGVSHGFVVAPGGEVSNQCDVVIYSRQFTPIIHTAEQQRFFPVESVVAVGEVKSVADSSVLRDALTKLVRVKEMRSQLKNAATAWSTFKDVGSYQPHDLLLDQIGTFIIAEHISCQRRTVAQLVKEVAVGRHPTLQVNLIVGIKDYCTAYADQRRKLWMYPVDVDDQNRVIPTALPLEFLMPETSKPQHLKFFLRHLEIIVNRTTILYPDFLDYFGGLDGMQHVNENDL